MTNEENVAVLGSGCFWCAEAIFQDLDGILNVEPGYAGGTVADPSYEQVCTGKTGHAEVVRITFDPAKITYRDILAVFFSTHDPTTLNRQGNDIGTQYRSVIFYMTEEQHHIAEEFIKELTNKKYYKNPIVTSIEQYRSFYSAEEYHKNYFKNNPNNPYCQFVIAPKLDKFQKQFFKIIRST
ncbi:MAG: peptide-methionine (S)-S-oxide reductase MsrA [Thermoplasmata archaeon]